MTASGSDSLADQAEIQARVFAFLGDPATHGLDASTLVRRIETHGAIVFLAGDYAYKVKRAVRFPFMDFSSLEKRRVACEHEIEVNRANAPEIYLCTLPIRQSDDGLRLGDATGTVVEWAVHLHRFDETQTFDHLADRHALDLDLMAPLADTIVAAHQRAKLGGPGATESLRKRLEDTLDGLAAASDIFPPAETAAFRQNSCAAFDHIALLLAARAANKQVRLCHGDLHLRNIVLYNDHPLLFDAIEFDDTIATCDILYDFAFILMDLWQRDLKVHASRLFNLYLWQAADVETTLAGLAALPLFLAQRAAIRARVTTALCRVHSDGREKHIGEARRFFAAARSFLQLSQAKLIAVGGLSGTGKSTFAQALAPDIGCAPGAVHLRSDIERKRMFNVGAQQRLPAEAYNPDVTEKVYARLRALAKETLEAGHSVIVDAVHAKADERNALSALVQELGVPFAGFWLEAPAETLIARVEAREHDASDAKESVVREQLSWELGDIGWHKLDASQSIDELRAAVLKQLV